MAIVKAPKLTKEALKFNNDKQRELMRVVFESYDEFATRKQHYYPLMGMSTAQIMVHAVQDYVTLKAFWPPELVQFDPKHGAIYQMPPETLRKVQSAVRSTLEQLEKNGYLEKVGNEHERRWRPVKDLMVKF